MFTSVMQERGHVPFPPFTGEKVYMVPFWKQHGLPHYLFRWQPTVDAMLSGIETERPVYLMVDQDVVPEGKTHRRPGVHVDGYWHPGFKAHGGGHHPVPSHHNYPPGHRGHGRHMMAGRWELPDDPNGQWKHVDFSEPEALLLSSDVAACRAYVGEFDGPIGEGGDCSGVKLDGLAVVDMMDHRAYAGTVSTLHESLPLLRGGPRTVVRLNCPGVTLQ
jgi:hypothetical protein